MNMWLHKKKKYFSLKNSKKDSTIPFSLSQQMKNMNNKTQEEHKKTRIKSSRDIKNKHEAREK